MKKLCKNHVKDLCKSRLEMFKKLSKTSLAKSEHVHITDESDPCPHCADNEDERDGCQMCQDLDAQENAEGSAGLNNCPMCQELDAKEGDDNDGCSMCQDMDQEQDGHICNCPNCEKNNNNEVVEQDGDEGPHNCPDCQQMFEDSLEEQPEQTGQEDPNLRGHQTAEEVLDELDNEPGSSPTPAKVAQSIDDTELPQGNQMEDGTSVTEDFGPAQKESLTDQEQAAQSSHQCNCPDCPDSQDSQSSDMPPQEEMSEDQEIPKESEEDQPNMTDVLRDGLEDHANEQRRQEVVDMVAQTLQGFKANKASLEASREQNEGFYNSCIQMLRSMIELCKLLGLEPKMPAQPPQQEQPQQPASQAAPEGGAAQAPKAQPGL